MLGRMVAYFHSLKVNAYKSAVNLQNEQKITTELVHMTHTLHSKSTKVIFV